MDQRDATNGCDTNTETAEPDPGEQLADVLTEMTQWPVYPGGSMHTVIVDGRVLHLSAGQLDWLRDVARAELDTVRNAHADGSGQCAHCAGAGTARPAEPTLPPTVYDELIGFRELFDRDDQDDQVGA
jgi:hypothetical protein